MAPDHLKQATMPAAVARTLVSAASRLVSTLFPALRQASRPVLMWLLKPLFLCCGTCFSLFVVPSSLSAQAAQAAELRALVERSPQLAFKKVELQIQPPSPDFGIGYPSSVA